MRASDLAGDGVSLRSGALVAAGQIRSAARSPLLVTVSAHKLPGRLIKAKGGKRAMAVSESV
jgi:hypothetical protein